MFSLSLVPRSPHARQCRAIFADFPALSSGLGSDALTFKEEPNILPKQG